MALLAAGGCRARVLAGWLRSAGHGAAAGLPVPVGSRAAAACSPRWMAPNHPPSASNCGRPVLLQARNPGAGGALPRAEGRLEQIIFSPATSVCCFSTSFFHGQSEDGRLIYTGNLAKAVWGVKFLSYFTSIFSLYVILNLNFRTQAGIQSLLLEPTIYGVGFMIFAIPIIMHLFTKGYVVRLYHKAETGMYTAITYNAILSEKRTVFHQRDVKVPTISKLFTTFNAKTKSMFVNPVLFTYPRDYDHLMGHDKPFYSDFEGKK